MKNLTAIKERFLRDPIPVRLGGLAANLARVNSFSQNPANQTAVFDLFEESKYFIEWTAAETGIETAVELVELQLEITIWQRNWQKNWEDVKVRELVANSSANWSRRLLERSGLLNQ